MRLVARCVGTCEVSAEDPDAQPTEAGEALPSSPVGAATVGPCQRTGDTRSTLWTHFGHKPSDELLTLVNVGAKYLWKCETGIAQITDAAARCEWKRDFFWKNNHCLADNSRTPPSDGFVLGIDGSFEYGSNERWRHNLRTWVEVSNANGPVCWLQYSGSLPGPYEHMCGEEPFKPKRGKYTEVDPRNKVCKVNGT